MMDLQDADATKRLKKNQRFFGVGSIELSGHVRRNFAEAKDFGRTTGGKQLQSVKRQRGLGTLQRAKIFRITSRTVSPERDSLKHFG